MSQKYELMVIISGKISDREVEERLKGLKEALGPSLTFEEIWGLRSLAYPIKKQSKGHYAVWNFISNAEALKELEGELKHFPDLLRYLLVTVPENYTPITLAQVEAGLEKLRAEKEEKRGAKNAQSQNRPARPERTPPQLAPKPVATEPVVEKEKAQPPASSTPVPSVPASQPEASAEQSKAADKKTLDEKLEDIFSDDLDLKL